MRADAASAPRCGLVAIVGKPNVGKSTLMNALVGQKISITSRKAQTTRHRILGVRSSGSQDAGGVQCVFVDTPGFQKRHGNALNRTLNRTVQGALSDVDVVMFVVEAGRTNEDDAQVLALIPPTARTVLVANKLDQVTRRAALAPWLQAIAAERDFAEIVPLCANRVADITRLLAIVGKHLPEQPWAYDADMLTDRNDRFLAAEVIREKLFRLTGDEVPYGCTVVIDRFDEEPSPKGGAFHRIDATIVVDREAHKGMVIGQSGEHLKRIGSEARLDLERLWQGKVHLTLWVKVKRGWADQDTHLKSYGYE
jgi:GTPase